MPFPPDLRREIRLQHGYSCTFCGRQVANADVHHKVPARDGGSDAPENAEVLCPACHDMFDYEQEEGGLTYEEALQKLAPYASYVESDKC